MLKTSAKQGSTCEGYAPFCIKSLLIYYGARYTILSLLWRL